MRSTRRLAPFVLASLTMIACGGSDPIANEALTDAPAEAAEAAGLRLVSAAAAKATIDDPPDDLVILDVRTLEEFAEGHIDDATMLDFYRDDFAAELALLDKDVPYVLYCRSGNRSGQTLELMEGLGFQNVQDLDGGVLGWQSAGLPLVTE